ncbi:alpha/beta fold hydrolase [Nocardia iowensis]|uniref:Alpha/beta hydrolase n=1 Tax=Nocardia iowensis TaxID=204891 RepID=A0ABX8RL76_NOCIO|nr:alpha/beta hydrolase [Nocardia iowensis]QXN90081.1 alpha/beta hydrolase [Nocardia iowensis]
MSRTVETSRLVKEWFRIAKLPHDTATKEFLDRCQSHTVKVDGKFYKYYQSGSGPTVLHVHGVRSNLGSMTAIAGDLLEQNYQVVLFDAPAHGEALGESTDPIEVRAVIRAIAERFPELHAVVGHSLGSLWSLSAWAHGLRAKAFVSISSPATMRFLVDKMADFFPIDSDQLQELADQIEGRLGANVWTEFSPSEVVKAVDVPGLIIHGTNDDYVPPANAEELHAHWRGSTVELIDGADHFDIVRSPKARKLIATFLEEVK